MRPNMLIETRMDEEQDIPPYLARGSGLSSSRVRPILRAQPHRAGASRDRTKRVAVNNGQRR